MLDIIIPVYKAKKTLLRLLMNIAIQRDVRDFNVYIVIDADDEDYSYEIDFVKKYYPLKVLKLKENKGPGVARQYGINNSNSPYIMFIDSDDYLYSPYSLFYLMNEIKYTNFDLLVSNFRYERDNEVTIKHDDVTWLHGKVYRRKFLEENDIHFNETRSNEDNGFNRLVLFNEPRTYSLDKLTYVYNENDNSITRRNNRNYKFTGLEYLCYNINWAMKKALSNNRSTKIISQTAYGLLLAMYYYYLDLYNEYNVDKILEWTKESLSIYDEIKKDLSEEMKDQITSKTKEEYKNKKIECIITFEEFLKKVRCCND